MTAEHRKEWTFTSVVVHDMRQTDQVGHVHLWADYIILSLLLSTLLIHICLYCLSNSTIMSPNCSHSAPRPECRALQCNQALVTRRARAQKPLQRPLAWRICRDFLREEPRQQQSEMVTAEI